MRRSSTAIALVASAALVACQRRHLPSQERTRGDAAIGSAASATVGASAAPIASGPCRGRAVGATACDGADVVACANAAGATERIAKCFDIERCDAERGACVPACPEQTVYVPATSPKGFIMGKGASPYAFGTLASHNTGSGIADAPHRVVLTRPFCMDATEVTGRAYASCVDEGACKRPKYERWLNDERRPDHPINMVDWTKAKKYCEHVGESLPTEAQWEWAATGGDGRAWPWGDEPPTCERADFAPGTLVSPGGDSGCHGGGTSPVGSHPAGDKVWPAGHIHDLAGNVWEWCLDVYHPYPTQDAIDPIQLGKAGNRVIRGGGWNRSARGILSAFRGAAVVTYQVPGLGFRCVRNAAAPNGGALGNEPPAGHP